MTTTQICALIVLIFSAGLLYLIGYRCGMPMAIVKANLADRKSVV